MKQINYSREAGRALKRIPQNWRKRIMSKIEQYAENPQSLVNNVIRMQGLPYYRLRVGDYRVIFDESDTVIAVIKVDSRGSVYIN